MQYLCMYLISVHSIYVYKFMCNVYACVYITHSYFMTQVVMAEKTS